MRVHGRNTCWAVFAQTLFAYLCQHKIGTLCPGTSYWWGQMLECCAVCHATAVMTFMLPACKLFA